MIDIKVIAIRDLLPVNNVSLLRDIATPSLRIFGDKFLQATEVEINNIPSPEFMAVNSSEILAQIPESQVRTQIRQVSVLATAPSTDRRSIIRFEVGRTFSRLQGLQKLIQFYTKILLQTPGSDAFDPEAGGGLLSLAGNNISLTNSSSLSSAVVSAITRSRDQVVARQSRIQRIPPDERLLRADVLAVGFNPATSTVAARVSIGAVSGREAVTNLTF